MSKYLVSEIRGRFSNLNALLEKVSFNNKEDELYSLGSLCDGKLHNLSTLEFLYSLKEKFNTPFGLNDIFLFNYFDKNEISPMWNDIKRNYTLKEISDLSMRTKQKYAEWLSYLPYVQKVDNYILCNNFINKNLLRERIKCSQFDITIKNVLESSFLKNYDNDTFLQNNEISQKLLNGDSVNINDIVENPSNDTVLIMSYNSKDAKIIIKDNIILVGNAAIDDDSFRNTKMSILNLDTMQVLYY